MSSEQPQKGTPWFIALASAVRECQLAATHGPYVSMLVLMVANIQDQTRRQGKLVPIYASQLMPIVGMRQEDSFRKIRQKAVDAGWLTYESGGTRGVGKYAAHHPHDYPGEIGSMLYFVPREIPSDNPNGIPPNSLPSPLPLPKSTSPSGADVESGEVQEKRPRKTRPPPSHTEEYVELANWMWELIHKMQPTRKPPNLNSWANDFRLLREVDKRTPDEMRAVFLWAHEDWKFWRKVILSPDKLRSKWDNLTLQMQEAPRGHQNGPRQAQLPECDKPLSQTSKYLGAKYEP